MRHSKPFLLRLLGHIVSKARARIYSVLRPKWVRIMGVYVPTDPDLISPEIAEFVYRGLYERDEAELIQRHIKHDDIILELGGGLGFISSYCAKLLGTGENVHVYEANAALIEIMRKTNTKNGVRTNIHNTLLAEKEGEMEFYVSPHFWSSSTKPLPGAKKSKVPAVSFADTLDQIKPTFMIVDIEGGEVDLLPLSDLSTVKKLCVEVHPEKAGEVPTMKLISHLLSQGFVLDLSTGPQVLFFRRPIFDVRDDTVDVQAK